MKKISDEEREIRLRRIALDLQGLHLERKKAMTASQRAIFDKKITKKRNEFIEQVYDLLHGEILSMVKNKHFGLEQVSKLSVEEIFDDVFYDVLLKSIEKIIYSDKKLTDYHFPKYYKWKMNNSMIDFYRKETNRKINMVTEDSIIRDDDEIPLDIQILLKHETQKIMKKFRDIVPKKEDRVFLRWFWLYKPGDKKIGKVWDLTEGSVKQKRIRLMKRITKELTKEQVIASQEYEMSMSSTAPSEKLYEPQISKILNKKLFHLLIENEESTAQKIFKDLFNKQLDKWILLRWNWLLKPMDIEMANVYEYDSVNELINFKRKTENELVGELTKNNLIKI